MHNQKPTSWCLIPPEIWERDDLSLTEKCLLGRINALKEKDGYCSASDDYLSSQLKLHKKYINRILKRLEDTGLIHRKVIYSGKNIIERHIYLVTYRLPPSNLQVTTPSNLEVTVRVDNIEERRDTKIKTKKTISDEDVNLLKNLPNEFIDNMLKQYNCKIADIENKALAMVSYCVNKNKSYKNYLHELERWLHKDYGKRKGYLEILKEENPDVLFC